MSTDAKNPGAVVESPDRVIASGVVAALLKERLVEAARGAELIDRITSGAMTAEDWPLYTQARPGSEAGE